MEIKQNCMNKLALGRIKSSKKRPKKQLTKGRFDKKIPHTGDKESLDRCG